MKQDTFLPDLLPDVAVERRRPGRIEYKNPYLIALLRSRRGEGEPGPNGPSEVEAFDPALESAIGNSVSVVDGACAVRSLPRSATDHARAPVDEDIRPTFLPNQGCYVAGTNIATAAGLETVDQLSPGDVVLTGSGSRRIEDIRPISFGSEFNRADRAEMAPIYVRRHALDEGVPGRDLWLAPTHCVAVGDQLVPSGLLANGLTVLRDSSAVGVQYFQVRYAEPVSRQATVTPEDLAPLQLRLAERAANLGYSRPSLIAPSEAELYLDVDGKILMPVEIDGQRRSFVVPRHQSARLASACDTNVAKIEIIAGDEYRVLPADHPMLLSGWEPVESDGKAFWRTLTGAADLPTDPSAAYAKIVVWLQN